MFDLAYEFDYNDSIKITKNLVYDSDGEKLKFDVYHAPKNNEYKNKTVVLIHGSAPMDDIKDIPIFQSWCKLLSMNGFDSVVFNWRPDIEKSDVECLINHLNNNSKSLDINSDVISLIGFSAGVDEGISQAVKMNTGFIQKLVVYYGQLDKSIFDNNLDYSEMDLLLAMAKNDDIFSLDCNDEFMSIANSKGWKTKKIVHSIGEHGFDAFNPCEETDYIINETLKFLSVSKL